MTYRVRLAHLIGDKVVPYEVRCALVKTDGVKSLVAINMASTGMVKYRAVAADQVYKPKLESV